MTYHCRISNSEGKITRRTVEASSSRGLQEYWASQGYYLISLVPDQKRVSQRSGRKAVLEMTKIITLMIQSGLTLKEAFEIGSNLFSRGQGESLIQGIHEDLRRGESFSKALDARDSLFPPLYLGMIGVGEKLGRLDRILPSLLDWLEKDQALRNKIKGALLYPALVMILVFSGIATLLLVFLPYMEEMMLYAGDGGGRNLARAYSSARALVVFFVSMILVVPLFRLILTQIKKRHPPLHLFLDRIKLKIPWIRIFLQTRDMLSLSFALAVLTECGVPLEEALLQGAWVMENHYLRESLIRVREKLLKGRTLSSLFHDESAFPPELANWTALGERTGRIDRVFEQLRRCYQREMDLIISRILTLAEPVVILFLGLVLGVIIIKIILPLLTLYGDIT
jgi:type II secretory pathway component PulF